MLQRNVDANAYVAVRLAFIWLSLPMQEEQIARSLG